ncbi:hypothetical protein VNO78_16081 [Psophocarpus tetragonolobus]|uniref:Uncharacterized protein n=1 Tax=Psophocarpus tetragonolobus TaxID=3891 RepID=A0AAN9SLN0_PSOTE
MAFEQHFPKRTMNESHLAGAIANCTEPSHGSKLITSSSCIPPEFMKLTQGSFSSIKGVNLTLAIYHSRNLGPTGLKEGVMRVLGVKSLVTQAFSLSP